MRRRNTVAERAVDVLQRGDGLAQRQAAGAHRR